MLNFALTFSISGISKLGHIGGFVTGLLVGLAIAGLPHAAAGGRARRCRPAAWARSACWSCWSWSIRTATW